MYLAEVLEETSRRLASEGLESTDSVLPIIATHHTGIAGNLRSPSLERETERTTSSLQLRRNFPVARCPSPLAVVAQSLSLLLKTFILSLCLRVWECGASGCVLHLLFLFSNAHSSPHIIHHGSIQRCLARHERCFKRQRPRRVEASQQAIQNRTTKDHRQKEKARSQSPSTKSDTSLIAGHDTNLSSRRHTVRNSRPRGTRSSHWAHLTSPNYVKNSQGSVDFRSTSSTSVLSQAQPSLIPDSNTTDT